MDLTYHVGIKDSAELKKTLLEASRNIIKLMQREEQFRTIRIEKTAQIIKLSKTLADIQRLVANLKVELPRAELLARQSAELRLSAPSLSPSSSIAASSKADVRVEDLEQELKAIEAKLNSLAQ